MSGTTLRIRPISPESMHFPGVEVLPRTLHADPRGFLLETLRRDDRAVHGDRFAMSYTSVTVPGEFRDRDRWHVHKIQTDRFVVAVGEMILALYDNRADSATHGHMEAVRMVGAPFEQLSVPSARDITTFLVTVPPGVCHCLGNFSRHPFVLINSPTELYSPADEGRLAFAEVHVDALNGPFGWDRVERNLGSE